MRKLLMCSAMLTMFIVLSQSQAQEFDRELFKLFGAAQKVIRDNPAMLASNPGVQKEIKMDEDQVKAVREKIGAGGNTVRHESFVSSGRIDRVLFRC